MPINTKSTCITNINTTKMPLYQSYYPQQNSRIFCFTQSNFYSDTDTEYTFVSLFLFTTLLVIQRKHILLHIFILTVFLTPTYYSSNIKVQHLLKTCQILMSLMKTDGLKIVEICLILSCDELGSRAAI